MGFLEDKLYWSTTKIDGSKRSIIAMIIDPVGALIQPAELSNFSVDESVAAQVTSEAGRDVESAKVDQDEEAGLPVESTK